MAKWLTVVTVVIAVAWSGWWFFGAQAAERGAMAGVQAARAEGWQIDFDNLSVAGFPNRFDTTVTAPRVVTPDGAVAFTAPFFQVFALAYRPNHVIAVAPPEMTVEVPGDVIEITSADLRGSAVVTASTRPVLDRSIVSAEALRVSVADLWMQIETGQFATRQAGGPTAHDVALSLSDLTLSPALRAIFDSGEQLPAVIDGLEIEAEVGLTGALGPGQEALVETILLRRAEVIWGGSRANLTGQVSVGPTGRADGDMTLGLKGWEPLVQNAVAQGLLTTGQAAVISAGIRGLANDDGVARVPATLRQGRLSVLGVPVAVLPAL